MAEPGKRGLYLNTASLDCGRKGLNLNVASDTIMQIVAQDVGHPIECVQTTRLAMLPPTGDAEQEYHREELHRHGLLDRILPAPETARDHLQLNERELGWELLF